jgi:isopentenyldiphosphate isomerase
VTDRVHYAFKFRYKAGYNGMGTEHEICAVTIVRGIETDSLVYDPDEISETKLVDVGALKEAINEERHSYTPWLVLAIKHMSGERFRGF